MANSLQNLRYGIYGWSGVSHLTCVFVCAQSEKLLLFDTVQSELEEKIRRLEEDRHSIDITSGNRVSTAPCHLSANVAKPSRNLSAATSCLFMWLNLTALYTATTKKAGMAIKIHV